MDALVAGDSYETPEKTRRLLGDRLAFGTRWYFTYLFARLVLDGRREAIRGGYDDAAWVRSSRRAMRDLEGCGARFHIRGLDNIRRAGRPVVFVGNHMSTLEAFVLPCLIAPIMPVTFVVKESLVKHSIFGPVMRSRDPVVVGRTNPREDLEAVLAGGAERLARGISMIVFPQATRGEVFDRAQFNSLGVKLARRARVRVVPMALKTDFWGNGKLLKDVGPLRRDRAVHMLFDAARAVEGNGAALHEEIVRFIEEHLAAWGAAGTRATREGAGIPTDSGRER
jgi:1-acyl-sn-glycerol-3-phosphate acyltransferase